METSMDSIFCSTSPGKTLVHGLHPATEHKPAALSSTCRKVVVLFPPYRSYGQDKEGQIQKVTIKGVSGDGNSINSACSMAHCLQCSSPATSQSTTASSSSLL